MGQCAKFPESLESFGRVWKISGKFGKFPDSVESLRTIWKVSGQSGKFPDSLIIFWKGFRKSETKHTFVYDVKTINILGQFRNSCYVFFCQ